MSDMVWLIAPAVFLGVVLFTFVSWVGILRLCAKISGWSALAKEYSKPFPNSSTPRLLRYLGLGKKMPVNYNHAIRARIQNKTLHLRPTILAKSGHTALAIPLVDLDFDHAIPKLGLTRIATLKTFPDRKLWFAKDDAAWIQAAQDKL